MSGDTGALEYVLLSLFVLQMCYRFATHRSVVVVAVTLFSDIAMQLLQFNCSSKIVEVTPSPSRTQPSQWKSSPFPQ